MSARIEPDRAALEIAHMKLRTRMSLDDMLKNAKFASILKAVARRHMKRRAQFDAKKFQSGDTDD